MFAGAVRLVRCRSSTDRSVKDGFGELGYRFVESGAGGKGGAQVYDGLGAFVESLDVLRQQEWRHLRVQPEYRYWICRPFGGHFLGLHASYTRFNAGGVNLPFGLWPKLEDQRVQGNEWAVGLGYGYHWILSRHWSLEAELGLGYSFADFDAYECRKCGDKLEERTTHRFVPTKLSVSFIYVFK